MHLWIMRHGEASFQAPSDEIRPLTARGQQQALNQGNRLVTRLNRDARTLDQLVVSPYLRAQQTFEALCEGGKLRFSPANYERWRGITPDANLENALNLIDFYRAEGKQNMLIVSHLPLVDRITRALCPEAEPVHFTPAVMVELTYRDNRWQLEAVTQPD